MKKNEYIKPDLEFYNVEISDEIMETNFISSGLIEEGVEDLDP